MNTTLLFPHAGFIAEAIECRNGQPPQHNAHVREWRGERRDRIEAETLKRMFASLERQRQALAQS